LRRVILPNASTFPVTTPWTSTSLAVIRARICVQILSAKRVLVFVAEVYHPYSEGYPLPLSGWALIEGHTHATGSRLFLSTTLHPVENLNTTNAAPATAPPARLGERPALQHHKADGRIAED
jgi:hypothetical protein